MAVGSSGGSYRGENGEGENGDVTEYQILREVFRREVCEGFDYRLVVKALNAGGFLENQPPGFMKKPRLPELGTVWVYAIRSSILES